MKSLSKCFKTSRVKTRAFLVISLHVSRNPRMEKSPMVTASMLICFSKIARQEISPENV